MDLRGVIGMGRFADRSGPTVWYGQLARLAGLLWKSRTPIIFALVALALRLPFLSASIDEIDSANFVNALDNGYDVPLLRPHAPGYPVYIFLGSLARPFFPDSVTTFATISALLGSLTVLPLFALAKEILGHRLAVIGTLLFLVTPLFWSFSETALSDVPSVFVVVTMAWLSYRGRYHDRELILASVLASLAIGIRQPNVAFIPLLVFPFVHRALVSRTPWKASAIISTEVFIATTVVWVASMVLIGSNGLGEYSAAVDKQWAGAVQPYSIFNAGSPWIVAAPERVERFLVGYVFTHPWTGIDSRTGLTSALQFPWILGIALFISRFSFRNGNHLFLIVWVASISYQVTTIHFLPRYGLAILPALVMTSMLGYDLLMNEILPYRNRTSLIALVLIGSLLILLGIKHQPPVAPFEWTPPDGTFGGAFLLTAGIAILFATRVIKGQPHQEVVLQRSSKLLQVRWFRSIHPVELILVLMIIPLTLFAFSVVSTARTGKSPNQQLVEYARENWDMEQTTVCWDGQTHGFFEVLSPGTTPRGFWTIDELYEDLIAGDTLLVTDYCVRFDEVASIVDLQKVAEFRGSSPLWSKAPTITLFSGQLSDPSP